MLRIHLVESDRRAAAVGNIPVRVKHKAMVDEDEIEVANGKTSDDGYFICSYTARQCKVDDSAKIALQVEVLDTAGDESVKSRIIYAPGIQETIELRRRPPEGKKKKSLSEFVRISESLQPLLKQADPTDLEEDQLTYLAHVSNIMRKDVEDYAKSIRLARTADIPEDLAFILAREGLSATSPKELLETTTAKILATIENAVAKESLSEKKGQDLRKFVRDKLVERQIDHALTVRNEEGEEEEDRPPTLGDLLATIPDKFALKTDTPRILARIVVLENDRGSDELVKQISRNVRAKDVATIKTLFALRDLTHVHLQLIQKLFQHRKKNSDDSIAYLAELKPVEWLELAYDLGPPSGSTASPSEYAAQLEKDVENRYSTLVFGNRLREGIMKIQNFPIAKVGKFLKDNPKFDLTSTHIEPFFKKNRVEDDDDDDDHHELKNALLKVQRVYALSHDLRQMEHLLNKGIDSATRILRYDRARFLELMSDGVPPASANEIYSNAEEIWAATLSVASTNSKHFNPLEPQILNHVEEEDKSVFDNYPTLRTLFGDLDYCECTHCRSVLSPAAYLVDLLQFLEGSIDKKMGGSALSALLKRRPDIVDLELSCQNTNTEIPYIDLVLELLENKVALPLNIALPPGQDIKAELHRLTTIPDVPSGNMPDAVLAGLRRTAMTIGKQFRINESKMQFLMLNAPTIWTISDGSRRWYLQYQAKQLNGRVGMKPLGVPLSRTQDIDSAVQELDQGRLNAQLTNYLVPEPVPEPFPPLHETPIVTSIGTSSILGGRSWRVQYVRGAAIKLSLTGSPLGPIIELLKLDGESIREIQKPIAYLEKVRSDLKSPKGKIDTDKVLELLGFPPMNYEITWSETNSWWEVRFRGDVTFTLQLERLTIESLTYQNSSLVQDILAYPENRNPEAYNLLADAKFPWSLPFSLWHTETNAFLSHLGLSRQRLMELSRPTNERLNDINIAREVLGISERQAEIIAPQSPHTEKWKYWGLAETGNNVFDHSAGETQTGTWIEILRRVSMLLQQSGLSFRELLNLLQTDYIRASNPALSLNSLLKCPECKPSKLKLERLNETDLDRMHRFVRLWRKLGWDMHDLDLAIRKFGGGTTNIKDITADTLLSLSLIQRIRDHLGGGISVPVVVSWFAGLDTQNVTDYTKEGSPQHPSLYASTFLKPSLHVPPDNDFNFNGNGTELDYLGATTTTTVSPKKLTSKATIVGAALNIEPSDIYTLVVGSTNGFGISDQLSLANLSSIFRIASLARALGITIGDYVDLVSIIGVDPFAFSASATDEEKLRNVLLFIENVEFIRRSGFTIDELYYLLCHKMHSDSQFSSFEKTNKNFLMDLRATLKSGEVLGEINSDNLGKQLARLGWYPELIESVVVGPEGVGYFPQGSIKIKKPSNPVIVPQRIAHIFYYEPNPKPLGKDTLGFRGIAKEDDFTLLGTIVPGNGASDLKKIYQHQMDEHAKSLQHQMQAFSLHVFRKEANNMSSPLPIIPDKFKSRMHFNLESKEIIWTGWMTADEKKELKKKIPRFKGLIDNLYTQVKSYKPCNQNEFLSVTEAKDILNEPVLDKRYRHVLLRLVPLLERQRVISLLSSFMNIDFDSTKTLAAHLKDPSSSRDAIDILTDTQFIDSLIDVQPMSFSKQFEVLIKLGKSAILVQKLRLGPDEIVWLTSGKFNVMDPMEIATTENSPNRFSNWRELVNLVRLRDVLPEGNKTINNVLSGLKDNSVTTPDIPLIFSVALDVSNTQVSEAATQLNFAHNIDSSKPKRLLELVELLYALKQAGIHVNSMHMLIVSSPTEQTALAARRILQANLDPETLSQRLKSVADGIRENQRDALIAFIVAENHLHDAESVFDEMLIDVKMGACMRTSRIKQAISSAQLFVERCLMNLESNVQPSFISQTRWQWMSSYRVWEANRKVFLHPENWIEPELRDHKSEIFRNFESDLLQSELSHSQAVEAFGKYLDKLIEISHLKVLSMFEEVNSESVRVVHLVARDSNKPYRYFYRQWHVAKNGVVRWTPWEEITLQMNADHALIFIQHGRIYVAWPTIAKSSSKDKGEVWEVTMNLGRRTTSGWTTTLKTSPRTLPPCAVLPGKDERTTFAFRLDFLPKTVDIICYGAKDAEAGNPFLSKPPPDSTKDKFPSQPADQSIRIDIKGKVFATYAYPAGIYYLPVEGATITIKRKKIALPVVTTYDLYTDHPTVDGEFSFYFSLDETPQQLIFDPELTLVVKHPKVDMYTPAEQEFSLPLQGSRLAFRSTIFERYPKWQFKENMQPSSDNLNAIVDETREVSLKAIGAFSIRSDDEIEVITLVPPESLPNIQRTEHFCSGFRERLSDASSKEDALVLGFNGAGGTRLLRSTPGHFILAHAASAIDNQHHDPNLRPKFWAYSDNDVQFMMQEFQQKSSPISYRLLADGHDYTNEMCENLYHGDVEAVMRLPQETLPVPVTAVEAGGLNSNVKSSTARAIDFDLSLPYADYNWEVFFHIPFLVAIQFSKDMRFEEAERWFHLIFDPTMNEDGDDGVRYWRFLPFRQAAQGRTIEDILQLLAKASSRQPLTEEEVGKKEEIVGQINEWKNNPFQPHAIARSRVRAYQLAVVLKYLENIIAWADQLFAQDTIESINKATQLYVRAARILGRRPSSIPKNQGLSAASYRVLESSLDEFSNAWINLEGLVQPLVGSSTINLEELNLRVRRTALASESPPADVIGTIESTGSLRSLGTLYFCVPHNEKLIEYWNTVDDRLFKIRHCMNIEGIERELPLFDPPIDPALLVKAVAAGIDLRQVVADLTAPTPHYRFSVILQKALELASEVKSMGASLLSALEKQDAEKLTMLRSTREIELLKKIQDVREQQIQEAQANLEALRQTRQMIFERYKHYQLLLGKADVMYPTEHSPIPREKSTLTLAKPETLAKDEKDLGLLLSEQDQLRWLDWAHGYTLGSGILSALAGIFHAIPDKSVNEPSGSVKFGGSHLGSATNSLASLANTLAANANHFANRSSILSSYQRRRHDWVLQSNSAANEMEQIDKQIIAAEIRVSIAEHELSNHEKQIKTVQEADEFMRRKFTSQQLYQWMVGQISAVYFRTYQLAFNMAKRAEQGYRFELGIKDSSFIRSDYWNNLKKGLLAGEHLFNDLKRMEASSFELNKREYEITEHISLNSLNPEALVLLKQTGRCEISIPEALFDIGCAGHFFRRIKSVGISIPCVVGPYTSVNCTLTLLKSSVRHESTLRNGQYARNVEEGEDPRFVDYFGLAQSIITSSSLNDSGLFETNLRDERYLPFEGKGVISEWRLELPNDVRQFDYDTISDIILHVRYTAREGGQLLRQEATKNINELIKEAMPPGSVRLFSIRHEFPNEWAKLTTSIEGVSAAKPAELKLDLKPEHYPFWIKDSLGNVKGTEIKLFVQTEKSINVSYKKNAQGGLDKNAQIPLNVTLGNLRTGDKLTKIANLSPIGPLTLFFSNNLVEDIWLLLSWGKKD
jgi:hypothetical protein